MTESRRGFLFGLAAYGMWGLFPLYWPLLEPAGALEILAHRIFWSVLVMSALVVVFRRGRELARVIADRRVLALLSTAALVITVNWGTYIWGVNNDHIVETSLGYFINPLVTVLMGVVLLGERLRGVQWVAMGIATVAVVGLTVEYGRPPWVALVLAFSFGTYGLLKKTAGVGAVESLTVETMVIGPVAAGYLVWLGTTGGGHFTGHGGGHMALIAVSGLVTAVPLIFFGAAANRVSLTTLGLLQYLAPTIQFFLGVFWNGEPMPPARLAGYLLVWAALALFTFDSIRHHRVNRMAIEAAAV